MNLELVNRIVNSVIYEGYVLYPYRQSAVKNQQRWNFGALTPRAYSEAQRGTEAWVMQAECLAETTDQSEIELKAGFLHLLARDISRPGAGDAEYEPVASFGVDDRLYYAWQEAVERQVAVTLAAEDLAGQARHVEFEFPAGRQQELVRDAAGKVTGLVVRRQETVRGTVEIRTERVAEQLTKIRVRVLNTTPLAEAAGKSRDEALMQSLVSTHLILGIKNGAFVSLLEPPAHLEQLAASCRNIGCWPVLVGNAGERDCLLCPPIILYDYPQVAAESAGDLFDLTEIDEMLTLRVLTLTDQEKREMRHLDERTRLILERVENLTPQELARLHGAVRQLQTTEEGL